MKKVNRQLPPAEQIQLALLNGPRQAVVSAPPESIFALRKGAPPRPRSLPPSPVGPAALLRCAAPRRARQHVQHADPEAPPCIIDESRPVLGNLPVISGQLPVILRAPPLVAESPPPRRQLLQVFVRGITQGVALGTQREHSARAWGACACAAECACAVGGGTQFSSALRCVPCSARQDPGCARRKPVARALLRATPPCTPLYSAYSIFVALDSWYRGVFRFWISQFRGL